MCIVGVCVVVGGMCGRGTCVAGGMHGKGGCGVGVLSKGYAWWGHTWQERWSLQWTVRILLECILV